jgi:hypothetical protein
VKFTAHLQLILRSMKCVSIHQLTHTFSMRSAYCVKYRDNLTSVLFNFTLVNNISTNSANTKFSVG